MAQKFSFVHTKRKVKTHETLSNQGSEALKEALKPHESFILKNIDSTASALEAGDVQLLGALLKDYQQFLFGFGVVPRPFSREP